MASLQSLALNRIPIMEIWNRGLLNSGLDQNLLKLVESKLTLENLYRQGLITPNLDRDLLAYILDKEHLENFLIPYIVEKSWSDTFSYFPIKENWEELDEEDDFTLPLFEAQSLYTLEGLIRGEEFEEKRNRSLDYFLTDLIGFLNNKTKLIHVSEDFSFIPNPHNVNESSILSYTWDQEEDRDLPKYRLFIFSGPDLNNYYEIYNTLDDLLRDMVIHLNNIRLFEYVVPVSMIPPSIRCSLQCLPQRDITKIWDNLKTTNISIMKKENFDMAPHLLTFANTIWRFGDYLYVVSDDWFEYYQGNAIDLLLNVLSRNTSYWKYEYYE